MVIEKLRQLVKSEECGSYTDDQAALSEVFDLLSSVLGYPRDRLVHLEGSLDLSLAGTESLIEFYDFLLTLEGKNISRPMLKWSVNQSISLENQVDLLLDFFRDPVLMRSVIMRMHPFPEETSRICGILQKLFSGNLSDTLSDEEYYLLVEYDRSFYLERKKYLDYLQEEVSRLQGEIQRLERI